MYSLYYSYSEYDENHNKVLRNECFYDDEIPSEEYKLISPNLKKECGKAGSISFILPPTNIGYDYINREKAEIICYKFDKEIWRGRILSDNVDFFKQRNITCEGELTYLNDTCAGTKHYKNSSSLITYYTFIGQLLDVHNQKNTVNGNYIGPYDKRIYRGVWPISSDPGRDYFQTKNETVLELINSIAKENNVYPKITWRDQGDGLKRYLDFVKGAPAGMPNNLGETRTPIVDGETTNPVVEIFVDGAWVNRTAITNDMVSYNNSQHVYNGDRWEAYLEDDTTGRFFDQIINQEIIFGENLLNFTSSYDPSQIITAVTLKGSKKETDDNTEAYYDLTGVGYWIDEDNGIVHPANADYIFSTNAVSNFGFREAALDIKTSDNEATAISQLTQIGKNYLRVTQFSSLVLNVSAVDLRDLGVNTDDFDIFYDVKVISDPHGLDKWFPIMGMEIPLAEPENSKFTMGVSEDITLTGAGQRSNEEFYNMIKAMPTEETVLNAAKNQASGLIKGAMTGYITIRQNQQGKSDAIIISQDPDWEHSSHGMWVWNSGGLGYFPNGWNGTSVPNNAMTSNGEIVADRITTGTLSADRIRGGHLIVATSEDVTNNRPWVCMEANFIGFRKGNLPPGQSTEVAYIKPQVRDTSGNNWMVYNSYSHCYECASMLVGNLNAISGTDNDHVSVIAFGGANDTNTYHTGVTYTNNDINNPPSNPERPAFGENIYILKLPNKNVYFKRGLAIGEYATIEDSNLFNGTLGGHVVRNGLILSETE